MKYFKNTEDNYVTAISTGAGMEEITQEEYYQILSVIHSAPTAETGYRYKLKVDLTWERVDAPPEETDPEISDEEALSIILGGDAK